MDARRTLICLIILAGALLPGRRVLAQGGAAETRMGPRQGLSAGGRGAYYRPKDADRGNFAEGAQVRFHFNPDWALEGSVDLRQNRFGEAKVDVVPLQVSLMVYLMPPGYRAVPYVLAGGGWYYTHVYAPVDSSEFRFGPHLGAGLDVFLDRSWSVDGSYRYLWSEDIHSQDAEHPLGRNFRDKGFMLTLALNYYF